MLPAIVLAADLEITPPPAPAPQAQPGPAPQAQPATLPPLGPPDATCTEWTDGCRTCTRPDKGETSCSNVGIACVQQAPRCVRR